MSNPPSRIFEYFYYSLPVIVAADMGTGIKDLFEGEDCRLWPKCFDEGTSLRNIGCLKGDPVEREGKGRYGREVMRARFNFGYASNTIPQRVDIDAI